MYILENVYPEEAKRYAEKIKQRRFRDWQMQLAITQNPHVKDPKQLWEALERESRKGDIIKSSGLDRMGLKRLKAKLRKSPSIKVYK